MLTTALHYEETIKRNTIISTGGAHWDSGTDLIPRVIYFAALAAFADGVILDFRHPSCELKTRLWARLSAMLAVSYNA
jgi:hypothetical protein